MEARIKKLQGLLLTPGSDTSSVIVSPARTSFETQNQLRKSCIESTASYFQQPSTSRNYLQERESVVKRRLPYESTFNNDSPIEVSRMSKNWDSSYQSPAKKPIIPPSTPPIVEQSILQRTVGQSNRYASLVERIRVLQQECVESHVRQQINTLLKETGMDPNLLPTEDKPFLPDEGRRRKSLSMSSSFTTYGNDDGSTGLELGLPPTPPQKPRITPHSMSDRDLNQLERITSLLSMTIEEKKTMPSDIPIQDSDETESSSDCCSDEENEQETTYNYLPVEDNPTSKWAKDRAQLICKWTWLKDALAEVNSQIEEKDKIYNHLKESKTPIQFEDPGSTSGLIPHDLHNSSSDLEDAIVEVYKSENGGPSVAYLHGKKNTLSKSPAGTSLAPSTSTCKIEKGVEGKEKDSRIRIGGGLGKLNIDFGTSTDEGCTARRCMPLQSMRRRKIYHLAGIKNMALQSKACSCFGKVELCPLCVGRGNRNKLIDCELMSGREIISHLDYCAHESISLKEETRLDLLIDSSLKLGTWRKTKELKRYNFLPFTHVRGMGEGGAASNGDEVFGDKEKRGRGRPRVLTEPSKAEEAKKRYSAARKLARLQQQRGSFSKERPKLGKSLLPRRKLKKRKHTSSFGRMKDEEGLDDFEGMGNDGEEEYAWRAPKRERITSEPARRSRRDQDYDIDNIVIPYSIASATRVEKIEYKEIITPSWRVVEESSVAVVAPTPKERKGSIVEDTGSDAEDLSELTISARHERSEIEEHKKFSIAPSSSRRGRRMDSKTESFSLDTPDAMSPLTMDFSGGETTLPPSPSGCNSDDQQSSCPMTAADASLALTALKLGNPMMPVQPSRRRTISSSKTVVKEEDVQVIVEEEDGYIPFEARKFPLEDKDYEEMLSEMPEDFPLTPPKVEVEEECPVVSGLEEVKAVEVGKTAKVPSPVTDGDSSDADDPDWEIQEGET